MGGQLLAADSPNYFDPGTKRFPLAERVEAVPLGALVEGMQGLFPQ